MKRFFLQVYGLIMAGLLAAMLTTNYFNNDFYAKEVEGDHLRRVVMLTQAIQRDIAQGGDEARSLAWWHQQLQRNDEIELEVIPLEPGVTKAYVKTIAISEAEDLLEIVAPLDATRALLFNVHDRSAPGALWVYYSGYALIYSLLAALLYALTYALYRHIDGIRQHAQKVANGDFESRLAIPDLAAFIQLHEDLNRMTQILEEKTQENHVLTGAIHHELRTPLTRLRLALDMALTTPRQQEVPDLMKDMDEALNDLSDLMEDLLTLSRLRLTGQPLPHEILGLDQLLKACIADLDDRRFELNIDHSMDYQLSANRSMLERALCNLIENARKFANQRVVLTLTRSGNIIELLVSDDGPGIPETAREKVRQPFFRADTHRNRATGGVGLGLAIADLALKDSGAQWSIGTSAWGGAAFQLTWQTDDIAPHRMADAQYQKP